MEILSRLLGNLRLNCIDVGARGGQQRHWRPFSHLLELDAFEPDQIACAEEAAKASPNEHWHATALADRTGTAKLYVLRKASSSSLFPPNPEIMNIYSHSGYGDLDKVVEIPVMSLGDFLDDNPTRLPNLIKLDTQGYELPILQSMRDEQWGELLGVQAEVEFTEAYLGQPLFTDVDLFLRSRGFIMFDILVTRAYRAVGHRRHHYLKKYLGIGRNRHDISARATAGDAFYIRPPEWVLSRRDRALFSKMLLVFLMYRCLDEALWFAEEGRDRDILTKAEFDEIVALVRSVAPRPSMLQRSDKIGQWARRLSKRFNVGRARKIEYWLDRSWDY